MNPCNSPLVDAAGCEVILREQEGREPSAAPPAMTLQARLRFNRQTQDNLAQLIVNHTEQRDLRDALIAELLKLVAEAAEIERQLLAA